MHASLCTKLHRVYASLSCLELPSSGRPSNTVAHPPHLRRRHRTLLFDILDSQNSKEQDDLVAANSIAWSSTSTKRRHVFAVQHQSVASTMLRLVLPLTREYRWRCLRCHGGQRLRSHRMRSASRSPSAHSLQQLPQDLPLRIINLPRTHRPRHRCQHSVGAVPLQSEHVQITRRERHQPADVCQLGVKFVV